jgi:hypothetical protein
MEAYIVMRYLGFYIFGSQMEVRLSALFAGCALCPKISSGTHFCYRLNKPQCSWKDYIHLKNSMTKLKLEPATFQLII